MRRINSQNLSLYNGRILYSKNGYRNIRIPGIICTQKGTMLCYYECRRGGDWSAIDIGMQKSTDGGNTWTQTRILVPGKGRNAVNNPVMIVDGDKIWFIFCENYKRIFIAKSTDDGESFSTPEEITDTVDALTAERFWSVLAAGPGHGIATKDHTLIVPIWFGINRQDIFSHHPSLIAVLSGYPECGIWRLSSPIGEDILQDPSECCVADTCAGQLILNIRNENAERLRAVSFSRDNGLSWSEPFLDPQLPDPVCSAGMCTYGEDILFVNCESVSDRKNLTLKRIGAQANIREKLLISEAGGYSDIVFNPVYNKVFIAYENAANGICVAKIEF